MCSSYLKGSLMEEGRDLLLQRARLALRDFSYWQGNSGWVLRGHPSFEQKLKLSLVFEQKLKLSRARPILRLYNAAIGGMQ